MPALTLDQPYASLVVLGIKTWETRPAPFNGDMRPAGVRGLPGLRINRGERIAVHASAKRPTGADVQDVGDWQVNPDGASGFSVRNKPAAMKLGSGRNLLYTLFPEMAADEDYSRGVYHRLPLGAIVGYVTVAYTRPIVDDRTLPDPPRDFIRHAVHEQEDRLSIVRYEGRINLGSLGRPHSWSAPGDISDQLPYGDWLSGRWASLLVDPEPCDPIPAKGKQGVWEWTP